MRFAIGELHFAKLIPELTKLEGHFAKLLPELTKPKVDFAKPKVRLTNLRTPSAAVIGTSDQIPRSSNGRPPRSFKSPTPYQPGSVGVRKDTPCPP